MYLDRTMVNHICYIFTIFHVLALQNAASFTIFKTRNMFHSNDALNMSDEYRPISDIVGNLHGGKYQFNEYGNDVFNPYDDHTSDPLYSFTKEEEEEEEEQEEDDESQMPKWAIRMKPPHEIVTNPSSYTILNMSSDIDENRIVKVTISNHERTWEKFYAKIMYQSKTEPNVYTLDTNSFLKLHPKSGCLAPRGGASNACDARNPYSDSVTLELMCIENVSSLPDDYECIWLVVGTEEEKWYYKINME